MKKFNFSLQKVLEIKEQLLENAKIELSNLNGELNKLENLISDLKADYKEFTEEFDRKMVKSVSVPEMAFFKISASGMIRQIENKEKEKNIVLYRIDEKKKEIIEKNTEISGLEKLKEKELDEYNKKAARSEELFIEEFVSNKMVSASYVS